ncbi:MAG: ATP-binding protein, partial [Leptolyngbya sp. RL_3_1]|nr:ATP-binding protein [Leptolyngbya sp. RL_3_1]
AIVEGWLLEVLQIELGTLPDWPKWQNRLRLVLVESYSNAVRHAHRDRPDLPVKLRLEVKAENLLIEVWDSGQGFDLNSYMPPIPEHYQEGGYGWLILNRLMDKVEYKVQMPTGQNCLRLQASLPPRQEEPPSPLPSEQQR